MWFCFNGNGLETLENHLYSIGTAADSCSSRLANFCLRAAEQFLASRSLSFTPSKQVDGDPWPAITHRVAFEQVRPFNNSSAQR
jgi:hypothetical protein